jgi:precorrin-8X/cobalt-precorrin-8 methylmutase
MERASSDKQNRIFVIGNAPTALIRICELIREGAVEPALVIGVPVGFVNVIEAKALLKKSGVPYIISEGRKGGSNVAAAIINALLNIATGTN